MNVVTIKKQLVTDKREGVQRLGFNVVGTESWHTRLAAAKREARVPRSARRADLFGGFLQYTWGAN